MTARNVQDKAKAKGLPWSAAKGFDTFCPIGWVLIFFSLAFHWAISSPFIPKHFIADPTKVGLHFSVNGTVKQSGLTSDMIFDIPQLIAFVSGIMKLEEGDLVLTGTPSGVGKIKRGEIFEAKLTYPGLDGEVLSKYEIECVERQGGYEFMP